MSEAAPARKIFQFTLLRRVFQFTAPYKNKFYLSLVMSIVLAVVSPVRPYLIQVTINKYIKGGAIAIGEEKNPFLEMVIIITVWQIVLLIAETLIRFYFSYITAWLGQAVVKDLRVKV